MGNRGAGRHGNQGTKTAAKAAGTFNPHYFARAEPS